MISDKSANWRKNTECRRFHGLSHLLALALFCGSTSSFAAENDYYYYCPRINASLVGNRHYLEGNATQPFPTNLSRSARNGAKLDWMFEGCSNTTFICMDVVSEGKKSLRLFVPRFPRIGKRYSFGSAHAFVSASTSSSQSPTIQVVVWQDKNESASLLKFTLIAGKGAIFVDGLRFGDAAQHTDAGTCILESPKGFFHEAKVRAPKPTKIIDY